jgi:hypothetical protein
MISPWRDFGGTQESKEFMMGPVKYKGTLFQEIYLGHWARRKGDSQ